MPGKKNRTSKVTLRDIAARAGVSAMTVSLALRNHPSIPQTTHKQIQALAEAMGYRKDPVVSELMSQLRMKARSNNAVIAFVTDFEQPFGTLGAQHDIASLEGARQRAENEGFAIEEFQINARMSADRLENVLWNRGVRGILVGPLRQPNTRLELKLDRFAAVAIGHTLSAPSIHRVSNNQMQSMLLAMRRLSEQGHKRISVILSGGAEGRVRARWRAGFLLARETLDIDPDSSYQEPGGFADMRSFRKWLRQHRPDAILTNQLDCIPAAARPPRTGSADNASPVIAFLHLLKDQHAGVRGIDQQWFKLGSIAVGALTRQMYNHEYGVPEDPYLIQIDGKWVDG